MSDMPAKNKPYLCFTPGSDIQRASARYQDRFGQDPAEIIEYKNLVWLGPVPTVPPADDQDIGPRQCALPGFAL